MDVDYKMYLCGMLYTIMDTLIRNEISLFFYREVISADGDLFVLTVVHEFKM
jgi:hypothetical protein